MGIAEVWQLEKELNAAVRTKPTVQLVNNMDYIEAISAPPIFKGYSRETGEALCEFKFNSLTEQFERFAVLPEEKWSAEEAQSVCRYLEYLKDNREELTRPVRIRPAK